MAESEFAVEMCSVSKRFPNPGGGEVVAVDQVSLEIKNGEFLTLLGPSGCGKTTSLRMIAGFEFPSGGAILIKGQNMGHKPPYLRPVNTVFQNYALFQHMTIAQNVAFGLEMDKVSRHEINQRVGEALEMVKLGGLGKRQPRQLSGGQQQRIALARALVKRPQVLLLDEPLGALDQKLRKEMQLELKALQQQVGITFVFVTHDQEEALTMSDRIAVMSKGKVLQIGGPVEIYERPTCQFVADFIGQTNFLRGKLVQVNDTFATAHVPALNQDFEGLKVGELSIGDPVVVSVRPEKVHLSDREQIRTNSFYARVTQVAYIGSNTHVYIETDSGVKLTVWEQNKISTLDPLEYYEQGDKAWVTCFRENVLVLPETEA